MLKKDALDFLSVLKQNNNREWFNDNKPWYERARADVEKLAAQIIHSMQPFDERLAHLEAKKCMFRIYKDTRFSKDKTPYKTNFGIILGNKNSGYYLHINPDGCFLASGFYQVSPEQLKWIRKEIYNDYDRLREILDDPTFKNEIGDLYRDEDALMRVPSGFDKAHPASEYLKLKHFYVMKPFDYKLLFTEGFIDYCCKQYLIMKPFSTYLDDLISDF